MKIKLKMTVVNKNFGGNVFSCHENNTIYAKYIFFYVTWFPEVHPQIMERLRQTC